MNRVLLVVMVVGVSCSEKKVEPPARQKPEVMEPLERVLVDAGDDRDQLYTVAPFDPVGPALPKGVPVIAVSGETMPTIPAEGPVVLSFDEDTYLMQVAALFQKLDADAREVWLVHPDKAIAFKVKLRDAAHFQAWIDEPVPGKLRVIHRGEGFELKTNLGKLPGGDPNGPTVPVRGGLMDLKTLQKGFSRVQAKFKSAPDVCFVPSFGTELRQVIRSLAVDYDPQGTAYFDEICLVYPREEKK